MIDKYIIYCICLWHFHVNQINSDHAHFPRKRRRQLYHAKKDALKFKKPMSAKTKLIKKRSTKDAGVYTKQINATRRVVTIKDKLAVVDFYEKLQAEKMAAQAILREPRLVNVTRKKAQEQRSKRLEAKEKAKVNLQRQCRDRFPHVVGKTQVCKWVASAKREHWKELPEPLRARLSTTPNSWREKWGMTKRGKKIGGGIPLQLQRELDYLMVEVSGGFSRVTDRREVVTTESVVAWATLSVLIPC
jgi:hypothetical protein